MFERFSRNLMRTVLIATAILTAPAHLFASEPTFPPGSSVGLTPPEGMLPAGGFSGFEDQSAGAAITLYDLPAEAFERIEQDFTIESLGEQGIVEPTRTEVEIEGAREAVLVTGIQKEQGFVLRKWILIATTDARAALVVGEMLADNERYDGEAMREALMSLKFRERPSLAERHALLPFRVGDNADFRFAESPIDSALVLTDGPEDAEPDPGRPIIIVTSIREGVPPADLREDYARGSLLAMQGLGDIRIERSQSFRQQNDDWHEIVATARDPEGNPLVVLQTLRFSRKGLFRIFATARSEDRAEILPRFRRVIDSVEPR